MHYTPRKKRNRHKLCTVFDYNSKGTPASENTPSVLLPMLQHRQVEDARVVFIILTRDFNVQFQHQEAPRLAVAAAVAAV